jgi:hypothetical protein
MRASPAIAVLRALTWCGVTLLAVLCLLPYVPSGTLKTAVAYPSVVGANVVGKSAELGQRFRRFRDEKIKWPLARKPRLEVAAVAAANVRGYPDPHRPTAGAARARMRSGSDATGYNREGAPR